MDDAKRIKRITYGVVFGVVVVIAVLILRGPYISNTLKKVIFPELERATGKNFIAKKIYINLFPLFVEAQGLKVFDEKGERLIHARGAKAYLDLPGLLERKIIIRRLVVREPEITVTTGHIEEILDTVGTPTAKGSDPSSGVEMMAVEVRKGRTNFRDMRSGTDTHISGLNGEILFNRGQRVKASAEEITVKKEGWPELTGDAEVNFTLRDKTLQVKSFEVRSLGSHIKGSGSYEGGTVRLTTDTRLHLSTVKKIFNLESSGEGEVTAHGDILYSDHGLSVALEVEGKLYLQALMELLEVKERVEGFVTVQGNLNGSLSDIRGDGKAFLKKGNLFGVDVDALNCRVSYADGTMKFLDGDSRLYNGSAKASASIQLPVVDYFTLDIDAANVDSKPLLELIGWDPGVQPGKVYGSLSSSGEMFSPDGWFHYTSTLQGSDILGRARDIYGAYSMRDNILSFTELSLRSDVSELTVNGTVNIDEESLQLHGVLKTDDVTDISTPYYDGVTGAGEFSTVIQGSFHDPVISGTVNLTHPFVEGYDVESVHADISYQKELLQISNLILKGNGEEHTLAGKIYFKTAESLFDFSHPDFHLDANLKNADLEKFSRIMYPDFKGSGRLHAQVHLSGTETYPEVRGTAVVESALIHHISVDRTSSQIKYSDHKLHLESMKLQKNKSVLHAEALIDTQGEFSYQAHSDSMRLRDLLQNEIHGDILFSLSSEGRGTFDNPTLSLEGDIVRGSLKGKPIGKGMISASLQNRVFSVTGNVINNKVQIEAKGRLEDEIPWDANVIMRPGRYDFLITSFLEDVPEDLILNLDGTVSLKGDRAHMSGSSTIKHILLSMYGYSFTNEQDIRVVLDNRKVSLNRILMRSGNTSLAVGGYLDIGEAYDLIVEGKSALSPFKALSDKIGVLKGDAEFVFSIAGDWDNPSINGGMNVSDGVFGLEDYYHRVSDINGFLYVDKDRIVLKTLSGNVGGGDIDISGIMYLERFDVKNFYVETKMSDISTTISDNFNVNFGGTILMKGAHDVQKITGDIRINSASYRERVEWRSWLLKAKKAETFKSELTTLDKAELNVRIVGEENIHIDNNIARATVSADMLLRGTPYRPILFGRLVSDGGVVFFRNNQFRIIHASADFADPQRINPFMEIAAETITKGYKIKMNLEGQTDQFNLSLSSDPPLKEMDILSLLTLGRTKEEIDELGLEGGIGASEATSFVTGELQDVIEERLTTITGLDRLQIDPYVSKTTGNVEPRVTVAKRLLGESMFVTYTTSLSTQEESVLKLEYFLSRSVSLLGVRDERGIFGGDVSFRFSFK